LPLPILLLRKRKLRHSLGKPSRSDFVQYDFAKETSSSVALEDIVMPLNFECL
jgi:hypothetical protein